MSLLDGFLKRMQDALVKQATKRFENNVTDMTASQMLEQMKMAHMAKKSAVKSAIPTTTKRSNLPMNNVNPLLSDFPEDDLHVGKRVVQANVTEADEILVNVQLADGSIGSITIKASTLAQIILDRNARTAQAAQQPASPTTQNAIEVGDGDLGGGNQQPTFSNLVDADELLSASKRRSGVTGGPVQRFA